MGFEGAGRSSADPDNDVRSSHDRAACDACAASRRRVMLVVRQCHFLRSKGGGGTSWRGAGNDRDADEDRIVRQDVRRVAMTRKPVQCLACSGCRAMALERATSKSLACPDLGDANVTGRPGRQGDAVSPGKLVFSSGRRCGAVVCGGLGIESVHSHGDRPQERNRLRWGVHEQCVLCADGRVWAGRIRPTSRAEADAEFGLLWAELLLSRIGLDREHRRQAIPHAPRLKCTVSQPACPLRY